MNTSHQIQINLGTQQLRLERDGKLLTTYAVATAANGAGERYGSFRTPRGRHLIRAKIGTGMPANTIFVERRPVGQWTAALGTKGDWILTRILWLSGREVGFNRLGDVDTMRRFIYIHGTPRPLTGEPDSHGCIRMNNSDIIDLFDAVPVYTPVFITP